MTAFTSGSSVSVPNLKMMQQRKKISTEKEQPLARKSSLVAAYAPTCICRSR